MLARLTIAVCLLAAVVETVLGCTSTAGLSPGDALIVWFVIGPYLLLALCAWRQRGQPVASWGLLAVAGGMSAWGLYVFAEDSYRYHTEPQYRKLQRLAVLFVPLVQWAIVVLVGLALLVRRLMRAAQRGAEGWGFGPDIEAAARERFGEGKAGRGGQDGVQPDRRSVRDGPASPSRREVEG
jgi:hypothetical protein